MPKPNLIAVLCADLHLTLLRPVSRGDADWMKVQMRYLRQLQRIATTDEGTVPILFAGDLFDRHNAADELLCFALRYLPEKMFCVPGQHDLPQHRLDLMHRSGYGVLELAGAIVDLSGGKSQVLVPKKVRVTGFGWEEPIVPPAEPVHQVEIALIHRYIWKQGKGHVGALDTAHISAYRQPLKGYDLAVFGDNHQAFDAVFSNGTRVFNCGGFIRRRSDEIEHRPRVGLLYSTGQVEERLLNISKDELQASADKDKEHLPPDLRAFLEQLRTLASDHPDFPALVRKYVKDHPDLPPLTRQFVLKALDL